MLLAFKAESAARFQESEIIHDGLFALKFDQDLESNPVKIISDIPCYFELDNSTVTSLCSEDIELYPVLFAVEIDTLIDTISIRKPQNKDRKDLPSLKILNSNIVGEAGLHPLDSLKIYFNLPLDSINRNLMNMSSSEIGIDGMNLKRLNVTHEWEEGEDYSLSLDSTAVVDFYGRPMDSTGFNFEIARRNTFGHYEISLINNKSGDQYILTFLNEDNKTIVRKNVSDTTSNFIIDRLNPGNYSIDIIYDQNQNDQWDTGDYDQKRQPEKLENVKLDPIESNRTTYFEVDFDALFNKTDTATVENLKSKR